MRVLERGLKDVRSPLPQMFYYLLRFPNEEAARATCAGVQVYGGNPHHHIGPAYRADGGGWQLSTLFPNTEVVVQRPLHKQTDEGGWVELRPRIVLPEYRVLIAMGELRNEVWDLPDQACECIAEMIEDGGYKTTLHKYVRCRPGREWHLPHIEPVPAGADFSDLQRTTIQTGITSPSSPIQIDAAQHADELAELRRTVEALQRELRNLATNDPAVSQAVEELDLFLAHLQCRFVNIRFVEAFMESTLRKLFVFGLSTAAGELALSAFRGAGKLVLEAAAN